jgi:ATP-dependent exoDNAse (exonuclease V) beta subunit
MRFIELMKKEEEEHSSISDFLDFIDEAPEQDLYVDFSGGNAVKLLTIHKAKGLGFEAVILPFLEVSTSKRGNRINYVVHHDLKKSELSLLRLDTKYIKFSKKLKNIYHREYLQGFLDELNTLYVSFTRAKEELYIFIPNPATRKLNIAVDLIPETYMLCGKPLYHKAGIGEKGGQILNVPVAAYKDWISFLKEEFIQKSQLEHKQQIENGKFMHSVLSHIYNLQAADLNSVLNQAVEKAKKEHPFYKNIKPCVKTIGALLKDKSVKKMFYLDEAIIFTEKEVINKFGQAKRIDRMIISEKEVWIIDYKSGEENNLEYVAQIKEYKSLISALYTAQKIRGFLVYIDKIKVEELMDL